MKHAPAFLAGIATAATLAALGFVPAALWQSGYRSVDEMDWDGSGSTSPSEVVAALDVVKVLNREKPGCFNYLDAKTGTDVSPERCADARR